ncbi:redoxin domain-containing protein [Canibacter oris]|uniref:Alkyl hydroperoxide reductase subunit AhpC n=1 Tax=Canibacter oris TaxID=1365628 RepID=A0A840DFQ8_9MICO|nr:redoxin domain-containing protein [Canibacter oris]MBB4071540.1 alkyl hydroperoxide reductase subunit AhpC [Canibacter oris]
MHFLHKTMVKIRGRVTAARSAAGSTAPDFSLPDIKGELYHLRTATAQQPQFLVFIPNAFTPVCDAEVTELLQLAPSLEAQLVIITCDSKHTLRSWLQTQQDIPANVVVVSDFWPHGKISRRYGAFNAQTGSSLRKTLLVDQRGRISAVFSAIPGQQRDTASYENTLAALRHAEAGEPFARA